MEAAVWAGALEASPGATGSGAHMLNMLQQWANTFFLLSEPGRHFCQWYQSPLCHILWHNIIDTCAPSFGFDSMFSFHLELFLIPGSVCWFECGVAAFLLVNAPTRQSAETSSASMFVCLCARMSPSNYRSINMVTSIWQSINLLINLAIKLAINLIIAAFTSQTIRVQFFLATALDGFFRNLRHHVIRNKELE